MHSPIVLRQTFVVFGALALFTQAASGQSAQQTTQRESPQETPVATAAANAETMVPRSIQHAGRLRTADGQPLTGLVSVTFSIYDVEQFGTLLWMESQSVAADEYGLYTTFIGSVSADGLPTDLFTTGGARWLQVEALGYPIDPRTRLVSVPYAIKAADADTLGGRPASAYMLSDRENKVVAAAGGKEDVITAAAAPGGGGGGGGSDFSARTVTATVEDAPGLTAETRAGPPLVIRSTGLVTNLNVDLLDGFDSSAFPRLAIANTFTANQTINGNLSVSGGGNFQSEVFGRSSAPGGTAIRGDAFASGGRGVIGIAEVGVQGTSSSPTGLGVLGLFTGSAGSGFGVRGETAADAGVGVHGFASALTGATVGVHGQARSPDGIAVFGNETAASGGSIGVKGRVLSSAGAAGLFDNVAGGNILLGQVNGVEKFRIDGAGSVFASAYKDLGGNPIPTGDITGVAVGTGLTGGGTSGDVTLGFDVAFGNAQYARLFAANSFTGNQSINGDLAVSSAISAGRATFAGSTPGELLTITQSGAGSGVRVTAANTAGAAGVFSEATSFSGSGRGVHGRASSPNGVGIFGDNAFGGIGVHGNAAGINSVGVRGEASNLSGVSYGVHGTSTSSSGIAVAGEVTATSGATVGVRGSVASADGVAGVFDNLAGGDIVRGQVGGVARFLIDGTGAVHASSYRDLAGNPIPSGTGDITEVAAGNGLIGGGNSGAVELALNRAYTDSLYAPLAHGHDVSQVANAASLGANSFSGAQTITGNVSATGSLVANTASFANGVTGRAVDGLSAEGVRGESRASGITFGVEGISESTEGIGVDGYAAASSGATVGINGRINSPDGVALRGSVNAARGVAGLFENTYSGNTGMLLVGRSDGVEKFRVDSTGAVYASSYRDLSGNPSGVAPNSVGSSQVIDDALTSSDLAPNAVTRSELAADSVTADKVAFNYAGSTVEGGPALDVACLGCVAASEVSFSFASLGANTFSASQTINAGNLDLDPSTGSGGNITKNGVPFLHNTGSLNTFLGENAGNFTTTGALNAAVGSHALREVTTGDTNTAMGNSALVFNTSGSSNTATGWAALRANISGSDNTATGLGALIENMSGNFNTAVGKNALRLNTAGASNVAIGHSAGFEATGSNNIYLGTEVRGIAGESNAMYLGKQGTQNKTIMAGVRGITTLNADAIPVMIDSAGQLGTVSSSRRFKDDIRDMADTSRRLFQLRPVTFRYKQAFGDGSKPIQYGLVAEEVAAVFPELAVRGADGDVETVHYETLNVLLLNELQKQQIQLERQDEELRQQRDEMLRQQERLEGLEQRLNELLGLRPANVVRR